MMLKARFWLAYQLSLFIKKTRVISARSVKGSCSSKTYAIQQRIQLFASFTLLLVLDWYDIFYIYNSWFERYNPKMYGKIITRALWVNNCPNRQN